MKLTIEKHPEYTKLAQFFLKIEAIAEKRGIDVDDLVKDPEFKKSDMYMSFKKNILSLGQKRSETLSVHDASETSDKEIPLAVLKVLLNQ